MGKPAQKKVTGDGDLAPISVKARRADRALIKALARRLSEAGPTADKVRAVVKMALADLPAPAADPSSAGGILSALRRSPLVAAEIEFSRPQGGGRKVEL